MTLISILALGSRLVPFEALEPSTPRVTKEGAEAITERANGHRVVGHAKIEVAPIRQGMCPNRIGQEMKVLRSSLAPHYGADIHTVQPGPFTAAGVTTLVQVQCLIQGIVLPAPKPAIAGLRVKNIPTGKVGREHKTE